MLRFSLSITAVVMFMSGCAQEPPPAPVKPQFRLVTGVHEVMEGLIAPAAEIVFKSVGYRATPEGGIEDIAPKDDVGWEIVEHSALGLAESANLLMIEGRAVDQEDWINISLAMMDTSIVAAKAAEAKDANALLEAGEKIFETCTACHLKYIPAEAAGQ